MFRDPVTGKSVSQNHSLITESTLAEIPESTSLLSLNGCCFITFLVIQQALIFWSSVPVPLYFTLIYYLDNQFHTIDIESCDELHKGSETLGLSGQYLNAVEGSPEHNQVTELLGSSKWITS